MVYKGRTSDINNTFTMVDKICLVTYWASDIIIHLTIIINNSTAIVKY